MSHVLPVYKVNNVEFISGNGTTLVDSKNKKYIDFFSAYAAVSLGHNSEIVKKAIETQLKTGILLITNNYLCTNQIKLAKKLCDETFADKVFFQNSGVESVELAMKIAKKYYHINKKCKKDPEIIVFKNAFHGRTMAAVSASGGDKMIDGFTPLLNGFKFAELNDIESVKKLICDSTCGILIEPIQGESGVKMCDKKFLEELRKICDKNDIALIFDEVQTGNGRTGHLFGYQFFDVEPDIMATAKGLGGGFPIGCCLMTEKYASKMNSGSHGTTFGGNPLAMSVGLAVFSEISKKSFLKNVEQTGKYAIDLLQKLQKKYPKVIDEIRGTGLIIGIKINNKFKTDDIAKKLLENGLVTASAGDNVIRVLPPLIIKKSHIKKGIEIIEKILGKNYKF